MSARSPEGNFTIAVAASSPVEPKTLYQLDANEPLDDTRNTSASLPPTALSGTSAPGIHSVSRNDAATYTSSAESTATP